MTFNDKYSSVFLTDPKFNPIRQEATMRSIIYNIQFLYLIRLTEGDSVPGNPNGIRKSMFLPLLFFFLICSALYGQTDTTLVRSFILDGIERQYLLYVPAAYNSSEGNWPLVINFHHFTSRPEWQMYVHSSMYLAADTAHFLVAYPQGLVVEYLEDGSTGAGWHIPGTFSATHNDVAFTDSLIGHINADFRVDLERVHAMGWGNGSMLAFYLACQIPDKIASVAGVAGGLNYNLSNTCGVGRPFSILYMHGTADSVFPFDDGITGYIPAAWDVVDFWWFHNFCWSYIETDLPDLVPGDSCTVTLFEFIGCNDNAEVLFYRINNGGHGMPGSISTVPFLQPTNKDMNVNSVIWNFFNRNPMPPITGIADNVDNSTKTFRLYQNYPNPFNPVTTITYSVLKPSHVELKIYNVSGQWVNTLANNYQTTGEYSAVWDGKDANGNLLASGIYFYRIRMGEFSAVRKMTYLR